ncbi:MAG: PilT protein domain protein [Microgenomates group bacterium GW2011_GWC1_41_8]|uniref:PilT protein domain protein n=3 Tax=Candidatus Roizmaniibacteriota TaxID=1752723 RepID=A0A0G0X971_9BACT|nr:MAG: PilT protein domain protein [Candidatus Roizmanbacteria bacterium GW2011_GWB1_40_7]KKR91626.1 MAG: PilT protein domain protein [Candidatus Roizmanbacteria bacterium GW2011_GWA1_41_13]KKS21495.1 MAG: PilT protein domain protein [Candidatus Roizmanbacteria bacterium GW2011_GWC2_41_7]KKS24224.1 MAG: PilT protein domain protein [Microgenomates group bacterium GW2011_GWC1_41_8]OGK49782.1 MAG: hypothetical protein A3A55_03465 [Candidatus Roizmanbacteria bacterium RIFCSPLOWO2_01_FULL_40_14]
MGKTNTRGLVIDTDIIIDYLRQSKQSTAFKQLLSENDSQPSIASVTITELWRGKSITQLKQRQKVNRLLNKLNIILADKTISQKAGELLRKYRHLVLADALVAATAIVNFFQLATFNKKHFEGITELVLYDKV